MDFESSLSIKPNTIIYIKWKECYYTGLLIEDLKEGIAAFVYGKDEGNLIGIGAHFTNETTEERVSQFMDFLKGIDFGPYGVKGCFIVGNEGLNKELAREVTKARGIAHEARGSGFYWYDCYRYSDTRDILLESNGDVEVEFSDDTERLTFCLR